MGRGALGGHGAMRAHATPEGLFDKVGGILATCHKKKELMLIRFFPPLGLNCVLGSRPAVRRGPIAVAI